MSTHRLKQLHNLRVLVTRPLTQAADLCQLINDNGAHAIALPCLEIRASGNITQIQNTLAKATQFQWLVFISANAVNFALLANGGKIDSLSASRCVAIGQATAHALESAGLRVALLPEAGYNSEALLAMPPLQQVDGQRFLIIRGDAGREELAQTLQQRGALVDYLKVYERLAPRDNGALNALVANQQLDLITLTSGEALQNLLTMLDIALHHQLRKLPLVVISERIKQLAITMGFEQIFVTQRPDNLAILETIIMTCNGGTAWQN